MIVTDAEIRNIVLVAILLVIVGFGLLTIGYIFIKRRMKLLEERIRQLEKG